MKKNRFLFLTFTISILSIIIGYLLWTILIPIQDIELLTKVQLLELQKELAINYWLGRIMMYAGAVGAFVSMILMLVSKIIKNYDMF